jgi:transposase
MISIALGAIYVATSPVDLRKSFDGLACLVTGLGHTPESGRLFCFFNKRANQVRILFWDRTGYCIWMKRLAQGRFHLRHIQGEGVCEMDVAELGLILEGLDLDEVKRRKRFRLRAAA